MARQENYFPLILASAVLSIAILVIFQIYLLREPARLRADAVADQKAAEKMGGSLYAEMCVSCHGADGEGSIGPALNSKSLLSIVSDDQFFSLIRSGVPGTGMPAWSQAFGGSLTDEEVRQIVAHIRAWEPGREEGDGQHKSGDSSKGLEIFESTCFICHGAAGKGTDRAPALNDPQLLNNFGDDWFHETISQGRPSKGMPTWGTVLSPGQIHDLVALLASWRSGAEFVTGEQTASGVDLFAQKCAGCHGEQGDGGIGPALRNSAFIISQSDGDLALLIQNGRSGTTMPGFETQLDEAQTAALIDLLRTWQP